jgi:hypothetical protein
VAARHRATGHFRSHGETGQGQISWASPVKKSYFRQGVMTQGQSI